MKMNDYSSQYCNLVALILQALYHATLLQFYKASHGECI
jgi:hypothetical protein